MAQERIDIGILEPQRKEIADGLCRLLADTYTLYLTVHGFHWNVTGLMFQERSMLQWGHRPREPKPR